MAVDVHGLFGGMCANIPLLETFLYWLLVGFGIVATQTEVPLDQTEGADDTDSTYERRADKYVLDMHMDKKSAHHMTSHWPARSYQCCRSAAAAAKTKWYMFQCIIYAHCPSPLFFILSPPPCFWPDFIFRSCGLPGFVIWWLRPEGYGLYIVQLYLENNGMLALGGFWRKMHLLMSVALKIHYLKSLTWIKCVS